MLRAKVTGIFESSNRYVTAEQPPRWGVNLDWVKQDGTIEDERASLHLLFDSKAEAQKYELGKVYDVRLTPSEL